ncbi:MAG: hypothetical protein JWN74_2428 [Acidobacteriaceae bacterium]|nr:hypothetical protein [Acidobacteriaceae bacterium]
MTSEIIRAAERTFHAAGAKPKDIAAIISKLKSEHQVELSVEGGLLTAHQGGALANLGTIIAAYRQKNPREFYGESGSVNFKDDLAGDTSAKSRFIAEHGFDAWNNLPLNEKSPGANRVVTDAIPSEAMKAKDYARLSVAEKSKLAGEIGAAGIERILSRR